MSTGTLYQSGDQVFLGTYFGSLTFFYMLTIILLILKQSMVAVVSLFTLRLIIQLVVFGKGMQRLKENDLIWFMPFFEAVMALIYPFISASNLVFKTKTWK
jgi:poly-beta-1,6-N-acetyl-D-glucosamine synthase